MTERLKMRSVDRVTQNIEKIGKLFPNAVTEVSRNGRLEKAIDFDVLRQELSSVVVEGSEERYQFTWPDKRKAILAANAPITATLRPCKEESVGRDGTPGGFDSENLYIEGDNLEVLKLLQETYLNKIKMIYIDPPYNTGNDFVYNDDFAEDAAEYAASSGQYDELGNRLVSNTESNGRFHTDWLNMIYPRLKLARDLLSDNGLIFISIDSNEVNNLTNVCSEVFGEKNFIAQLVIENNPRGRQSDMFFATSHEYLLCYGKNTNKSHVNGIPLTEEQIAEYRYEDEKGRYRLLGLRQRGVASLREDRPDMFFPIWVNPADGELSLKEKDGWEKVVPHKSDGRDGRWMWGKQKCETDGNRLVARFISSRQEYDIFVKDYVAGENGARTRKQKTVWTDKKLNNQLGTQEVKELMQGDYMSFPKSTEYIKMIIQIGSENDSIVMDFFSGSATTAHAVMQLNAEDGGKRKFIMVQIPEPCKEDSDAYRGGYPNICEIGKERIRRAGRKIKEEAPLTTMDLDTGFRVFKLDTSNMKDVYYAAGDYNQGMLEGLESNIKEDRTEMDLLFGCLLDWGLPLSLPYASEIIDDCMVQTYNEGDLIACFADNIPESVVKAIARRKPLRAVFRDASFADSPSKINVGEIFKLLAPETSVKVI